jgi:hypothetical protein
MRSQLLVIGLGLLGASLLVTLLLLGATSPGDYRVVTVVGWFAQATLYVGAGLTVAGAVLHELRRPELEPVDDPADHYGS